MPTQANDSGERALAELSPEACSDLLRSQEVGRLGVIIRFWPVIVPVNYRLDVHTLVIRTADAVAAAADHANVTFEIDQVERTGWSVLVRGLAEIVGQHHRPAMAERTHRVGVSPWAPGDRGHWIRIIPQQITGRRITADGLTPGGEDVGYL